MGRWEIGMDGGRMGTLVRTPNEPEGWDTRVAGLCWSLLRNPDQADDTVGACKRGAVKLSKQRVQVSAVSVAHCLYPPVASLHDLPHPSAFYYTRAES